MLSMVRFNLQSMFVVDEIEQLIEDHVEFEQELCTHLDQVMWLFHDGRSTFEVLEPKLELSNIEHEVAL